MGMDSVQQPSSHTKSTLAINEELSSGTGFLRAFIQLGYGITRISLHRKGSQELRKEPAQGHDI